MLLYVHRNRRLIRDGSPGRPSRLSHSSYILPCVCTRWASVYSLTLRTFVRVCTEFGSRKESAQNLTSGKISAQNLTPGKISAQNVTPGKISEQNLTPGKISAQNLTPGKISAENLTPGKITAQNLTPGKISRRPPSLARWFLTLVTVN